MLLINKGKRTIDGIKPLETKEIEKSIAENLLKMYGNELVIVDTPNSEIINEEVELLKKENSELKLKLAELTKDLDENKGNIDIESLKTEFFVKFNKEVPRNMSNNIGWIKKELAK